MLVSVFGALMTGRLCSWYRLFVTEIVRAFSGPEEADIRALYDALRKQKYLKEKNYLYVFLLFLL